MNPYQAKDTATGQTWTLRPKYPDFGGKSSDAFKPGSFWNPMTITSEDD
jgi:hypothetical protein